MLEIQNLFVDDVLKGVNLGVPDGARIVLRGENGAGKTTLVSAIIGARAIKSGSIILDGSDMAPLSTAERARLGLFVGSQSAPEIPGLSVSTFLKHSFMALHGNVPMKDFLAGIGAARERLGIPEEWMPRSVNVGFSGGEKKRLMFLQMMTAAPKMAILDEFDSGADMSARKLFSEIIAEMRETTFLIITHQEVFFEASATAVLRNGRIVIN